MAELIRQVGITEQTLYRWKKQYKRLETDQVRQCKQLKEENARLKRLVAELTLDKTMLQDVLAKKTMTPSRRRPVVEYLHETYRVSSCVRAMWRGYRSRPSAMRVCRSRGPLCACEFGRLLKLGFATDTENPGAPESGGLERGEKAGLPALQRRGFNTTTYSAKAAD